ncbi:MAG: SDR family NAD(P)-dependent oxidoreductase [Chloroflexota bacterium]|nr:SDR family NAD(P)-dependent oxidoreductase [Chloroflexota bacterium]
MNLQGSTALVTGAASGLGEATARTFASQGARVYLIDRDTDRVAQTAASMGMTGIGADVTDPVGMANAVARAVFETGGLHLVVNCAGIVTGARTVGREGDPHDLDLFIRTIQVNLIGTFNVIRLSAAAMRANTPNAEGERGVIIATASVAAYDGQIGQAAYAASKGGIAAMTLPIARDLARDGIRVMTIAPGVFATPMMASLPEAARTTLEALVPFPSRLGKPEEYALLVAAIVGNPMLNGEVIRLDGALRMPGK